MKIRHWALAAVAALATPALAQAQSADAGVTDLTKAPPGIPETSWPTNDGNSIEESPIKIVDASAAAATHSIPRTITRPRRHLRTIRPPPDRSRTRRPRARAPRRTVGTLSGGSVT